MDGSLLVLLYSLVLSGAEGIENFPKRMKLWLVSHGFVTASGQPDGAAFRGRLYNIVGTLAVFGLMVMLYSMVLGSATYDPAAFRTKFKAGMWLFGLSWAGLLLYLFMNFNRLLLAGLLALSGLFLYISVDNLSGLIQTVMPVGGVVNSMTGSFPVGKHTVLELEMVTRTWVLFGLTLAMVGFMPIIVATSAIKALFALLSVPLHTVVDLLRRLVSDEEGEAEAARNQLTRLTEKQLSTFNLVVLGLCLLGVALSVAPNIIGLMFAVAIGMVSAVTLISKKGFGVVGHDLSKYVHGATIAVVLGTIGLYLIFIGITVYRMGPQVYVPLGILFVALFVMLFVVVKNTTLRAERDEYASGDVDLIPYMVKVKFADGKAVKEAVYPEHKEKKEFSWNGITKALKVVLAVVVLGGIILWLVFAGTLGVPGPLAMLNAMSFKDMMACLILIGVTGWLIEKLFKKSGTSSTSSASSSGQEGRKHV